MALNAPTQPKAVTCCICGKPAMDDPCPECHLRLRLGVVIIPVKGEQEDSPRLNASAFIWYREEKAKSLFGGTPALPKMLAARKVRMPVTAIEFLQLPAGD